VEVSKLSVVWLTALLALGIVFAGHAEAKALFEQRPATITAASLSSVSSSPHSNALGSNSFPTASDGIILALPFDRAQEAYWTRVTDYPRQIHGITRAGHGTAPLGTGHGCKFALHEQSKLAVSALSSGSLSSSSPPGLILRL